MKKKCTCIKCKKKTATETLHESSCGSYDDYHYKCSNCGYSWWCESGDY